MRTPLSARPAPPYYIVCAVDVGVVGGGDHTDLRFWFLEAHFRLKGGGTAKNMLYYLVYEGI